MYIVAGLSVDDYIKVPMMQLLQVLILFKKSTFSQIRYLHGNAITTFSYTDYIYVINCDNSQRSHSWFFYPGVQFSSGGMRFHEAFDSCT